VLTHFHRASIQWKGVPNPQSSDLIGLWVGKDDVQSYVLTHFHRASIQWKGVPNPQSSDLIGLWVGKDDVDPR